MFGKRLCGLLCAAALSYVCSGQARAEEPGVSADTISIGAFGPITGPAAYIGLAGRDGGVSRSRKSTQPAASMAASFR